MTPAEFKELLSAKTDVELLDTCLLGEEVPFVCKNAIEWTAFRKEMAAGFAELSEADIRIVGSGRHGFSLRPRNHLRAFAADSDIDVVVVSPALFDKLWIHLLEAAYPRLPKNEKPGGWDVPGRAELFSGWLTPSLIHMDWKIIGRRGMPLSAFKVTWFNSLKSAARNSSRPHNDIGGRLYRTWRHAELYHLFSISELRRSFGSTT